MQTNGCKRPLHSIEEEEAEAEEEWIKAKPEVRGSDSSRFRSTLPGLAHAVCPPHRTLPNSENLTAAAVEDQRPLTVAVMSAAATGTSKAAHGDAGLKKKKGPGALATAYLVIYNVVMTAGYVACFLLLTLLSWSVSASVCCWGRRVCRTGARFIVLCIWANVRNTLV